MIYPSKINIGDRIKCIESFICGPVEFEKGDIFECLNPSVGLFEIKVLNNYLYFDSKSIKNNDKFELVQDFKVGDQVKILVQQNLWFNKMGIIDAIIPNNKPFEYVIKRDRMIQSFQNEELELVQDDLINEFDKMVGEEVKDVLRSNIPSGKCCDKPNIKTNFVYPNGMHDPIAFKVCSNCKKEVI